MELGTLGYDGDKFTDMTEEEQKYALKQAYDAFIKVLGRPYTLIRAPRGRSTEYIRANSPAPLVYWSIDTGDWNYSALDAEDVLSEVDGEKENGAIVLHTTSSLTVEVIRDEIEMLKAAGYELVTVSELIEFCERTAEHGKVYSSAFSTIIK